MAKDILLEMGHFFQVQDDYLDCFGDPSVTGKVGTDIEDNKCSWLVNQALLRGSDKQKTLLETNYARKDPACVCKHVQRDVHWFDIIRPPPQTVHTRVELVGKVTSLTNNILVIQWPGQP